MINPKKVKQIKDKVSYWLAMRGLLNPYDTIPNMATINEQTLFYLQVGEAVLDLEIEDWKKHKDDWHFNQSKEWQKANCSKLCNHERTEWRIV